MITVYILLGFVILYSTFRSFPMGIAGAIMGLLFYKAEQSRNHINRNIRNIRFKSVEFPETKDSFIFFSQCTFSVMGHICKSKGRVTENDIKIAVDFMDQLNLRGQIRTISQESFNRGKNTNFNIDNVLREFYQEFHDNLQILDLFLEIQIKICFSDGRIEEKEKIILKNIANKLNISSSYILRKIKLFKSMYDFEHNNDRYSYNYDNNYDDYNKYKSYSYKKSYNQKQNYNKKSSNNFEGGNKQHGESDNNNYSYSIASKLDDAYKILGVNAKYDQKAVKQAYRKLMNEYHPDKLAAKKIPKEYYEIYNEKSKQIINSYKMICDHNGWK